MRIIKNIKDSIRNIKNINEYLDYVSKRINLENELMSSDASLIKKNKGSKELIVSLTTYSKRIYDVAVVIESLGRQTVKANKIILWLDEGEFSLDTIPLTLVRLIERGLEVRFYSNIRSYKKLVPTLEIFGDANIITVDDDIIYPPDMIEDLINSSVRNPKCVVAHHIHHMTYDVNGRLKPYNKWLKNFQGLEPSHDNVAIGVGGVFYPSGSLSTICTEKELFERLAPNADDIWFKAMSVLNGYKTVKANNRTGFNHRFTEIPLSQDIALFNSNMKRNENDKQIEDTFFHFKIFNFK